MFRCKIAAKKNNRIFVSQKESRDKKQKQKQKQNKKTFPKEFFKNGSMLKSMNTFTFYEINFEKHYSV